MAKAKTIQDLQEEQKKMEEELKLKTQKLKALKQQEKELARKERTHRLCTHGAMLEQYLPPEEFTDDQIDKILRSVFQSDNVKQFMYRIKEQTDEQPETG